MKKILRGLLLLSAVSGAPGNSVSRALSPAEGNSIKTAPIAPPATGNAGGDFNFSQLEVVSRTEMLTQHYETEYGVKWDNDYNLNSADYFGFFTFCRFSKTASPLITVSHQVDYYGSCWFGLESNIYSMPA